MRHIIAYATLLGTTIQCYIIFFRPEAIDLSLCNHEKTVSESIKLFEDSVLVVKYSSESAQSALATNWHGTISTRVMLYIIAYDNCILSIKKLERDS